MPQSSSEKNDGMTSRELLDRLLEGNAITSDELVRFVNDNPEEDQYVDYKNGIIISKQERDKGRQTIREYVSGFANSDGGVLIIGIDESRPRQIAACEPSPGGQPLEQWASRCLHDMVAYFSPQPRFQVINQPEGPVLAIAVARAPSLVPCLESREQKYFFRIEDSTLLIPEYLIADLVLGRRQHPFLDVHSPSVSYEFQDFKSSDGQDVIHGRSASISFVVENVTLAAAEDVQLGLVSWSLVAGGTQEINRHLAAHLDVCEINSPGAVSSELHLVHRSSVASGKTYALPPFQKITMRNIGPVYFPRQIPAEIRIAVYVLAKGTPPTWFQLEFGLLYGGIPTKTISEDFKAKLLRKGVERPQVAWMPD